MFETSAQRGRFIIIVLVALWVVGWIIPFVITGGVGFLAMMVILPVTVACILWAEWLILDWWEGD